NNDPVRIGCRREQVTKTVGSTRSGSDFVASNTQFTTNGQTVCNVKLDRTKSSKVGCFSGFTDLVITEFGLLAAIGSAFGRIVKEETANFRTNTVFLR